MSFGTMSGWVLACGLPAAAGAAWIARRWGGPGAPSAAAAGAGIALAVVLASGAVVARAGARSSARAAFLFLAAGMVRSVLAAGLAAGAWAIWHLPGRPLLLSMLACYAAAWGGECFWVLRAIRAPRFVPGQGATRAQHSCTRLHDPAITAASQPWHPASSSQESRLLRSRGTPPAASESPSGAGV